MLHADFISVMEARNVGDLRNNVVAAARQLGFDIVSATAVLDHSCRPAEFHCVDNTPAAYQETFNDPRNGQRDPVCQHCKHQSTPIIWDQQTYVLQGQGDKWEEQAHFGYRTGISVATHLPGGRHFFFGVDRDQALPAHANERVRLAADVLLLASYLQDVALRLLLPMVDEPPLTLSPRELETLSWTLEGKTAWEVGAILGISEQTAARHVNNAARKLGCVNKMQAVAKALRLGLIC